MRFISMYLVILLFFILYSCSHSPSSTSSRYIIIDEKAHQLLASTPGVKAPLPLGDTEGTVLYLEFNTNIEAMEYAMQRRLILLRKYEILNEPYFGTANAKECSDNLRSNWIEKKSDSLSIVLQLLSLGPSRAIRDCLTANNSDWVNIHFLVCGNRFYDIRNYYSITNPRPEYHQIFFCQEK